MLATQSLFAVLIDGDNAMPSLVPQILSKLKEYGEPFICRVFANRTSIVAWDDAVLKYSIGSIRVPNITKGKNAVDISIVIAAMDFLYNRPELKGFCIVSSDGDFTELASYLKEKHKFVLGIGDARTPDSFVNACSEFVYVEKLSISQAAKAQPIKPKAPSLSTVTPKTPTSKGPKSKSPAVTPKTPTSKASTTVAPKTPTSKTQTAKVQTPTSSIPKVPATPTSKPATPIIVTSKLSTPPAPKTSKGTPKATTKKADVPSTVKPLVSTIASPGFKPPAPKIPTSEFDRLYKAYKHAADVKMLKDEEGWVMLAIVEDSMRELYEDYNPLVHYGTRYKIFWRLFRSLIRIIQMQLKSLRYIMVTHKFASSHKNQT
jgi:hypothetical protein